MKLMRWVRRHKMAIAIILGLIVLIVAGVWFWGVLVGYVKPAEKGATHRKDVVQAFALIVAGVVGAFTAIAAVGNFYISRRNLQQQRDLADQHAQADALQTYFEKLGELVQKYELRTKRHPYDDARIMARAQTLTVLRGLDPTRKAVVLQFLRELRLINRNRHKRGGVEVYPMIVGLNGADLSDANLRNMRLISGDRTEAVSLQGANLKGADLQGTVLERADLSGADLSGADLSDADLSDAILTNAKITKEQLDACRSLQGATMPNGQKYED